MVTFHLQAATSLETAKDREIEMCQALLDMKKAEKTAIGLAKAAVWRTHCLEDLPKLLHELSGLSSSAALSHLQRAPPSPSRPAGVKRRRTSAPSSAAGAPPAKVPKTELVVTEQCQPTLISASQLTAALDVLQTPVVMRTPTRVTPPLEAPITPVTPLVPLDRIVGTLEDVPIEIMLDDVFVPHVVDYSAEWDVDMGYAIPIDPLVQVPLPEDEPAPEFVLDPDFGPLPQPQPQPKQPRRRRAAKVPKTSDAERMKSAMGQAVAMEILVLDAEDARRKAEEQAGKVVSAEAEPEAGAKDEAEDAGLAPTKEEAVAPAEAVEVVAVMAPTAVPLSIVIKAVVSKRWKTVDDKERKQYKCSYCGFVAATQPTVMRHISEIHRLEEFACPGEGCLLKTSSYTYLRRHAKSVHGLILAKTPAPAPTPP